MLVKEWGPGRILAKNGALGALERRTLVVKWGSVAKAGFCGVAKSGGLGTCS